MIVMTMVKMIVKTMTMVIEDGKDDDDDDDHDYHYDSCYQP